MTTDAWLAIAHHVAVFALLGVLVAEFTIVRPGMLRADAERAARIDAFYGLAAVAVVGAGISRLVWGAQPWDQYSGNPVFWLKMAAIATVALLSIVPTARFARWRSAPGTDPPSGGDVGTVRRFLHLQLALFPIIPVAAALMARGIGN